MDNEIMDNYSKIRLSEEGNSAGVVAVTEDEAMQRTFETLVGDYYDCVFEINVQDETVTFYHISVELRRNGINPAIIHTFMQFSNSLANNCVVEEERKPFKEQMTVAQIKKELTEKGSFVKTVHCEEDGRINAKNIRVNYIGSGNERILFTITDISMILDHDWMTDELSRSGFISNAEEMLRNPEYREGYSIVYTNIQGFKAVNDMLGPYSGDMVIFMERDILVRELQPLIISRFESDHFVMLTKTSILTPEKLDQISHQKYEEGYKELPILIRFGICNVMDSDEEVQHMVDRAKLAEKTIPADHGVSYAFCDEGLSSKYVEQRRYVSELDGALERGEFKIYFQPVVDVKTCEIVSAEALIRWAHSQEGIISPGKFIPVFEREGVISKIDSFMVNRVLNINLELMHEGKHAVPCAVNLSRVDFYDTKLIDIMRRKMKEHENISDMLKLEVTESAYAVLESNALNFMDELKKLGVSLLLDDFGSGMSSFSTLESFEFDIIKLDMGFVSQIGKKKKTEAIIKHIIGLSHDVGARVVAEGVETEEQLEFLRQVNCDMIQGYYFYKPMPEEDFIRLLSEQ